jgi:Rod binding domain-containing protein
MDSSIGFSTASVGADLARAASSERSAHAGVRRTGADAANSFEEMFATLLVKEMRRALPEGFFGKGTDGDVYAGWLDQTLGQAIAASGALRLSQKVREAIDARAADGVSHSTASGASEPPRTESSTGAAIPEEVR